MAFQYYNANTQTWHYTGMTQGQVQDVADRGAGTFREVEGEIPDMTQPVGEATVEQFYETMREDFPSTPVEPVGGFGTPTPFTPQQGLQPPNLWGEPPQPAPLDPRLVEAQAELDAPLDFRQYQPLTTGGAMPDTFTQPYAVGSPQWMEEVYGPRAGYMTGLGLFGQQARTPYQSYQENLYGPLSRLYDLSSQFAAGGVGETTPGGFMGQWGQPYAQNPFAMYAQARGMMGQVMGMSPEQRAGFGLQGPTPALQELMGQGLRQELGIPGAAWLSGRLPQEEESWVSQYPQQQGPSFLDYVTEKYNLGRFFQ